MVNNVQIIQKTCLLAKLTASDVPQKFLSEGMGIRVGIFDADDVTVVSDGLPDPDANDAIDGSDEDNRDDDSAGE